MTDGLHGTDYDEYDMRPKRKQRRHNAEYEWQFQVKCVVHYTKLCRREAAYRDLTRLYAVAPNDGLRTIQQAAKAKRMGQKPGVYDLHFLDRRNGIFRYTWIECKAKGKGLSDEQIEWDLWLTGSPIRRFVVRTIDEFQAVIK